MVVKGFFSCVPSFCWCCMMFVCACYSFVGGVVLCFICLFCLLFGSSVSFDIVTVLLVSLLSVFFFGSSVFQKVGPAVFKLVRRREGIPFTSESK